MNTTILLLVLVLCSAASVVCDDEDRNNISSAEDGSGDFDDEDDESGEGGEKQNWDKYSEEMQEMQRASWKLNHGKPNAKAGFILDRLNKKSKVKPTELGPYLEGDILFQVDPKAAATRSGIVGDHFRWPNGRVIFQFSQSFNNLERRLVYEAMRELSKHTCIVFERRRLASQMDFVEITNSHQGCFSGVGRQRGRMQLNLQRNGCMNKGTIMHELIHAIGFFHEQSRSDRDAYVQINWHNIAPTNYRNFQKHDRTNHFGLTYDFKSIMHYSYYAFSLDQRSPTILIKTPHASSVNTQGRNEVLSQKDIDKINLMYKCKK